jgi:hypothetical protein
MWSGISRAMKASPTAVVLASAGVLLFSAPAWSDGDTQPIQGGPGGSTFRAVCPAGTFWFGITGKAGNTIEKMQLLCAHWHVSDSKANFIAEYQNPVNQGAWIGVGDGGSDQQAQCSSGFVKKIAFNTEEYTRHFVVDQVNMSCSDITTSINEHVFGHNVPTAFTAECKPGEYMTGLTGRMGQYVDALAGVCATLPFP